MAELSVVRVRDLARHPHVDEWQWDKIVEELGDLIFARCVGIRRFSVPCRSNMIHSSILTFHMVEEPMLEIDEGTLKQVSEMLGIRDDDDSDGVEGWNPEDSDAWKG